MKPFLITFLLLVGTSSFADNSELMTRLKQIEGLFNYQIQKGDLNNGCVTGSILVAEYQILLDGIKTLPVAATPEGQHAVQNLKDQITLVSGICAGKLIPMSDPMK